MAFNRFGAPASPWAERYGIPDKYRISFSRDKLLHSSLRPLNPELHPRYYDRVPPKEEFEFDETFGNIDHILATEEYQKTSFNGLSSWNLAPLNAVLSWDGCPPLLGGHRPGDGEKEHELYLEYLEQRIEVDEESWLPFFRRDRWYDLRLPNEQYDIIENADGSVSTIMMWSASDDRIWHHLRFCIEIANRILVALVTDQNEWFMTLLYGRIQLWYELYGDVENAQQHRQRGEDMRIILPIAEDARVSAERGKPPPTVQPHHHEALRISFVKDLLRNMAWGFIPSFQAARGKTMALDANVKFFQVLCRLSVNTFKLLCGGKITIAERCFLYTRMAITILHELTHAIFRNRLDTYNNISPEMAREMNGELVSEWDSLREPFFNNEPIAELGRSMEASVFGGTPLDRPSLHHDTSTQIIMTTCLVKYPSKMGGSGSQTQYDLRNAPMMERDAPVTTYFLPAALMWRLQSKAFWDSPSGVDGKTAFRFPRLFTGVMQHKDISHQYTHEDVVVDPDAGGPHKFSDTVNRWNEQVRLWSDGRPWHRDAFATWRNTAWGHLRERAAMEIFSEAYKARDESACVGLARTLQAALPEMDVTALPHEDATIIPKYGSRDGSQPLWLIHCLGTLMLAALPLRGRDVPEDTIYITTVLTRSENMPQRFLPQVGFVEDIKKVPKLRKRRTFFSRASDRGKVRYSKRAFLVDQVRLMIVHIGTERGCYIPLEWFYALFTLISYMHKAMILKDFDEEAWLPLFPFRMPSYDPSTFKRWNGDAERWEDVELPEPGDSLSNVLPIGNLDLSGS